MNIFKYLNHKNNRNFGFLLTSILLIIYFYLYFFKNINNFYLLFFSSIFLILAFTKPKFFQFFNFIWLSIGFGMAILFSNFFLAVFFYIILTPIALISRLFNKNTFNLRFKGDKKTFWTKRISEIKKMKYQS